MKRFPVLLLIALLSSVGSAQSYQFFSYGLPDGLCDKFTYTINQDQQGFLWIGTSQGLCRFDGRAFEQVFNGDSIPDLFINMRERPNQIWFNDGDGNFTNSGNTLGIGGENYRVAERIRFSS